VIFQSFDYLIFLLIVVVTYWRLPMRVQNWFLLAASLVFYGYVHPWYCALVGATILIDYSAARMLSARPQGSRGRKRILATSLTATFSILCWFKYFNFFTEAFWTAFAQLGIDIPKPIIEVLLPVGISFYTFQSASYVVDVFRGRQDLCRRLDDYALFVVFFPQLVAGPIERAGHLLGQITRPRVADAKQCADGFTLIIWGVFKKVVIADSVGIMASRVFSIQDASFPMVWAGVIAFGVQIFADFSAYTDIARGTAKLLGFDLMKNFNHPYAASSPVDFWRRWHISLSTWFRDYVYIPLGGSRCGRWRVAFNLLLTFALSGLWHGANWNFIIWGVYHGILVAIQHLWQSRNGGGAGTSASFIRSFLARAGTFVLVHIGWLFFREQNFDYLIEYLSLSPFGVTTSDWETGLFIALLAQLFALPLWIHGWMDKHDNRLVKWLSGEEPGVSPIRRLTVQAVLVFVLALLITSLRSPISADFIYFQF